MKNLFFVISVVFALLGCNKTKNNGSRKEMDLVMMSPPAATEKALDVNRATGANSGKQEVTRKIIKEGELSFETHNINETRKAIYNSLQRLGGYVAEEKESNDTSNDRNECVINARIPEKSFDEFLTNVSSSASRIDSKNIRARDVTSEYIDITTHLANKKKLEERYVELLKKGNKMSDLLEIENKISQIQTSIDSTQGQLNYLEKQVEFSSLDITFYTKKASVENKTGFVAKFVNAISAGWSGLGEFFLGFMSLWPMWVIGVVLFFPIRKFIRTNRRKKKEGS